MGQLSGDRKTKEKAYEMLSAYKDYSDESERMYKIAKYQQLLNF